MPQNKKKLSKAELVEFIKQHSELTAKQQRKLLLSLSSTDLTDMSNDMLTTYIISNFTSGLDNDEIGMMLGAMRGAVRWARDHSITYSEHDHIIRRKRKEKLKELEQKIKNQIESKPNEHSVYIDIC